MQIYKVRLMDRTGWSFSGFTDVRVIADNLEEAKEFLSKSHPKENWAVYSVDTFEVKKGLIY